MAQDRCDDDGQTRSFHYVYDTFDGILRAMGLASPGLNRWPRGRTPREVRRGRHAADAVPRPDPAQSHQSIGSDLKSIIVLGAEHVGRVIADDLAVTNDYRVTLAERRAGVLNQLEFDSGVEVRTLDVEEAAALKCAPAGQDAVVSACPYFLNARIAEAARSAGVNYFDLTEDVATTRQIRALAEGAVKAFVPQCGLAPGAVGIVGNHLASHFDRTRALPQTGFVRQEDCAAERFMANRFGGMFRMTATPCEAPGTSPSGRKRGGRAGEKLMTDAMSKLGAREAAPNGRLRKSPC